MTRSILAVLVAISSFSAFSAHAVPFVPMQSCALFPRAEKAAHDAVVAAGKGFFLQPVSDLNGSTAGFIVSHQPFPNGPVTFHEFFLCTQFYPNYLYIENAAQIPANWAYGPLKKSHLLEDVFADEGVGRLHVRPIIEMPQGRVVEAILFVKNIGDVGPSMRGRFILLIPHAWVRPARR